MQAASETDSGGVHPPDGDYSKLWKNYDIGVLVVSTKDYIVHIDNKTNRVEWGTTPQYDQKFNARPDSEKAKHHGILMGVALLEATPCEGISEIVCKHFESLLGEAVAYSFEQDYTSAKKILEAAGQYIEARSEETSRYWYLTASLWATLPFIVLGGAIWIFRDCYIALVGVNVLWLSLAITAGAVGALFSVIARTGRLKFDCSAGKSLHNLEGSSRIVAGAISGLLVALAVQSEVILAPLARGERLHLIMVLAALAAGAGERLATSIISKFDTTNPNMSGGRGKREV